MEYCVTFMLDSTVQWHIVSGPRVTGCSAVWIDVYIGACLFESRGRAHVTESITSSYARQHDVLELISQHATLASPQPNCALHLSKCHRQRCFKTPLCVLCEKSQVRVLWRKIKRWQKKEIKESRRKYQKPGGEKNTFPGHDIRCCYGYLSHTSTSLKVNTA